MPVPSTPIRAVLFDAGNTLFFESPTRFEIYAAEARDLGLTIGEPEMREAMRRVHEATPPVPGESARYTERWFETYIPRVFERVGAPTAALDGLVPRLRQRYRAEARLELFPETVGVIERLRRAGIRAAIVSNWSPRLLAHLDALDLTRRFDAILVSAIEGVEKPSPEIFRRACQRLDVGVAAAIHVGDHRENDAAGARAAGLGAVWLDRSGGPPDPEIPTVRSLEPLLSMVGVET